jgi:N-acetylneuraminic acid mutarotase
MKIHRFAVHVRMLSRACTLVVLALTAAAHAASWKTMAALPAARSGPAAETVNGLIYVVGGNNAGDTTTVQVFDPTTNQWTAAASLPEGRYSGDGAGVINSQLYVAGGWTISPPLPHNSLFMYDPPSNTWTARASLSHLSACGATGVINSKLYVTTACDGFSGYRNFLDVYDPFTDSWTSLAGSHSAHAGPAAGVINDKLYIAGGNDGVIGLTKVLEVYDPATNTWATLAPMKVAVINPASVALNGRLYVFGGNNGTSDVNTVQVYDPHRNKWTILIPSMPTARNMACAAIAYGIVFVEGGGNSGGLVTANEAATIGPTIP